MTSYQFKLMIAVAAVLFCGYLFMLAWQRKNIYFSVLATLASCYGLGKVIQFWHLGPMLFRCYLSDIGFIPFLTLGMVIVGRMERAVVWARLGLVIALAMEGFQLVVNPALQKAGGFGPRGDWVDVVIFVSSYFVVRWLVARIDAKKPKPDRRNLEKNSKFKKSRKKRKKKKRR